ncbi:hypothetical protein M758_11G044800 [Ceratodon purpureus]|nr:hypothetical protein M758_11G044800 [Ceratodon purpureus]
MAGRLSGTGGRYEADDLHLLWDKAAMKLSASVKACTIIGTLTAPVNKSTEPGENNDRN